MTAEETVLVVEDETALADLYAAWLGDSYDVRTAYDGQEAMAVLDDAVEAALLDRRMPGMSGDRVLDEIREEGYRCRVAMVTAVEPDFDILDMGFDDYLVKPVSQGDLLETVERLLDRREYEGRLDEYATLVSKMAALETEKSAAELEESEEFRSLRERADDLRADLDPMVSDFDDQDVAAVLRDLPVS